MNRKNEASHHLTPPPLRGKSVGKFVNKYGSLKSRRFFAKGSLLKMDVEQDVSGAGSSENEQPTRRMPTHPKKGLTKGTLRNIDQRSLRRPHY